MSASIEKLNGIAFLAFEDNGSNQRDFLFSELRGRFGVNEEPTAVYGDLIYYEDWDFGMVSNLNVQTPADAGGVSLWLVSQ